MSKFRRPKAANADRNDRERVQQEIFAIHKQLSELWERAGNLWQRVPGKREKAEDAYSKSAVEIELACDLLSDAEADRILALHADHEGQGTDDRK